VEGEWHQAQGRFLLPAPSYAHTRGLVPGVWSKGVEMAWKVVRASRDGAGSGRERGRGGGGGKVVLIGDAGYSRLFRLRL